MSKNAIIAFGLATLLATSATAAPPAGGVERLHYKWSLRGALSWIARAAFPTSGTGTLETTGGSSVSSKLMVGDPKRGAHIFYESNMTNDGQKTLTSSDGYVWRDHDRKQLVTFDYLRRLARVEKNTEDGHERKVRKLNSDTPKDVLTAIYYIRQNLSTFTAARQTEIYSSGKPYSFIISPQPAVMLNVSNKSLRVRPFLIEPVDKKRGGTVRVWISDDGRNLPVQIEIQRDHATLLLSATNV
jgi:hypothetical protein